MDLYFKNYFLSEWDKYFNGIELPIAFMYADDPSNAKKVSFDSGNNCLISLISQARWGNNIYLEADGITCSGAKKSLGFEKILNGDSENFCSVCNTQCKIDWSYKKDPSITFEWMKQLPQIQAPTDKAVFKRWDRIEEGDNPQVVIFFVEPNELSGLFSLANFDELKPHAVNVPYIWGCASITLFPVQEIFSPSPKPVLGMLDVTTRPYVPQTTVSFAVPFTKFEHMVNNMHKSVLRLEIWRRAHIRHTYPCAQRNHRLRCHF